MDDKEDAFINFLNVNNNNNFNELKFHKSSINSFFNNDYLNLNSYSQFTNDKKVDENTNDINNTEFYNKELVNQNKFDETSEFSEDYIFNSFLGDYKIGYFKCQIISI